MRLTRTMSLAMREAVERRSGIIPPSTQTMEIMGQALLDCLYPIPPHIDKVHDRDRTCWRRSVDDPEVWATSGRSRVLTSYRLSVVGTPLTWKGNGE